jgi:hypothetical protein
LIFETQQDMNKITLPFLGKGLRINTSKSKLMIFTKPLGVQPIVNIKIIDEPIEQVHSFKYLGLHFTHNLSWHLHLNHLSHKIRKGIAQVSLLRKYLPSSWSSSIFHAYIQSHITSYILLWGASSQNSLKQIQLLQNVGIRRAFNVSRHDHMKIGTHNLYRELDIPYINQLFILRLATFVRDRPHIHVSRNVGVRTTRQDQYAILHTRMRFTQFRVRVLAPVIFNMLPVDFSLEPRTAFTKKVWQRIKDNKNKITPRYSYCLRPP